MAERVEKSDGDGFGGGDRGLTDSPNSSDSPRELRTTEGASGLQRRREGAGADRQRRGGGDLGGRKRALPGGRRRPNAGFPGIPESWACHDWGRKEILSAILVAHIQ